MNPEPIKYITTCRICRQQFRAAAFLPIVAGNGADPRIIQFGTALVEHMFTAHQQEMGSFLLVCGFDLTDPSLIAAFDPIRWAVHSRTRKNIVTDEKIAEAVDSLDTLETEEQETEVRKALGAMRDYLTESGADAPGKKPEPARLIRP